MARRAKGWGMMMAANGDWPMRSLLPARVCRRVRERRERKKDGQLLTASGSHADLLGGACRIDLAWVRAPRKGSGISECSYWWRGKTRTLFLSRRRRPDRDRESPRNT